MIDNNFLYINVIIIIILLISSSGHIIKRGIKLEDEKGIGKIFTMLFRALMPILSVIMNVVMRFLIRFVDSEWWFKGPFRRVVPWLLGNAIVKIAYGCEVYTTDELVALYQNLYKDADQNGKHLHIALSPCICRAAINNWSEKMPNLTCLHLNFASNPAKKYMDMSLLISAETAIQLTKEYASKWPFVHTVFGWCPSSSEYFDKQFAICFCHHHCAVVRCEVKRGKYGLHPITKGRFFAKIDKEKCNKCGTCQDKCPFFVVKKSNEILKIDPEQCFGCGVCERFCPNNAIEMIKRPKSNLHFIRTELIMN